MSREDNNDNRYEILSKREIATFIQNTKCTEVNSIKRKSSSDVLEMILTK